MKANSKALVSACPTLTSAYPRYLADIVRDRPGFLTTRLLDANEHLKIVQELLGPANFTVTLELYSHYFCVMNMAAKMKC
ncbi:hypothetical protein E4K67_22070 [Desulfosporosinus fructosivorans]|uniref:Uncharacterized protein n=1 Tax=Desulfosporosinus fructosivorans TaxID=2018669 RepID=A0A4Z0QZD6_9FIRM|nr:hypothetical protein E4K67_22070 [Desulfosporosinus fructosivorans]